MDPCKIIISTSVYNTETGAEEPQAFEILTDDVFADTEVTMDDLAKRIAKLSAEDRATLAAQLLNSKSREFRFRDIKVPDGKTVRYIGNITIDDLFSIYPGLNDVLSSDLISDKYTIIRASKMVVNGRSYSGRVLTPDGHELFIIGSYDEALNFLKYVQSRETVRAVFQDETEPLPEGISEEDLKNLDKVAKRYKCESRFDIIMKYLNDRDSVKNYTEGEGENVKTIPAKRIVGDIATTLAGKYNFDRNLTELEDAIKQERLSTKGKSGKYNWKVTKESLYNILGQFINGFADEISYEDFMALDREGLNKLLFGLNGVFHGHPKLMGARILSETQDTEKVTKRKTPLRKTKVIQGKALADLVSANFDAIIADLNLTEKQVKKYRDEEGGIKKFISNKNFKQALYNYFSRNDVMHEVGGESYPVKTRKVKDANGNETVKFYYEDVQNENVMKKKATITMTFPYSSIGDVYSFGYGKSESLFAPVSSVDVASAIDKEKLNSEVASMIADGKYRGYRIYKTNINNRMVYTFTRNIISPGAHMNSYPTLEATLKMIDLSVRSSKICDNSLLSFKLSKEGAPRRPHIQLEDVRTNQVIEVSQYDLSKYGYEHYKNLPLPVKAMMEMTMPKFQAAFSEVFPGISSITSLEDAATFLIVLGGELGENVGANTQEFVKAAAALGEERLNELVQGILDAPKAYYYIEDVQLGKKDGIKVEGARSALSVVRQLPSSKVNNVTDASTESKQKVDRLYDDTFVAQNMNVVADHFNDTYGVKIHAMSASELEQMSIDRHLGFEHRIGSVKAFIYRGEVYLNTSNANVGDLCHEIAHIYMGVLKVTDPDGYNEFINGCKAHYAQRYESKLRSQIKAYPNMARPDLEEEAIADLIGQDLFYGGAKDRLPIVFNGELNTERLTNLFTEIANKVNGQMQENQENGLGFDSVMSRWTSDTESEMAKRRMVTGFIQDKIAKKEIIERC